MKKFTIIATIANFILRPVYGFPADYEYFGLPVPDQDEISQTYADIMYDGYREDRFYKYAEEYVNQNLSECGLINSGILILNLYNIPWNIEIEFKNKVMLPNLSRDDKKAFLMAMLRSSLFPKTGIYYYKIERNNCDEYLRFKIENINYTLRNLFRFSQQDNNMFTKALLSGKDLVFFLYNKSYDNEIIEVLKKIYPNIEYETYKDLNVDFESVIAKNYRELSYDQLIEMFNFIKASWDTSLSTSSYFHSYDKDVPSEDVSILLSKDTGRAFIIALSRMRLTVNDLFPLKIKMPDGEETQLMGGWFYSFVCTLPQIGKYEFSIKDSSEGVVWVKSLEVEGDTRDRLIPNGKYYSPELYNVVLSIFGELARKDFQESMTEKQGAKAE